MRRRQAATPGPSPCRGACGSRAASRGFGTGANTATPAAARASMSASLAKPPSTRCSPGRCPWTSASRSLIGRSWPLSEPLLSSVTAAIMPLRGSLAKPRLKAGRKPPSGILITRASASVVETRGSGGGLVAPLPAAPSSGPGGSSSGDGRSACRLAACRLAASCPATASAASTRRSRSAAARRRASARRRRRPPGAVLRHPRERGVAGLQHRREAVDQQLLQHGAVGDPELRQGGVVHADPAAQPLEADVLAAQPVQLAGAAHTLHRGVEPERQQNAGVGRRVPRTALDRLDRATQRREIEPLRKGPDEASPVIRRQPVLQAEGPQAHLPPLGLAQPWRRQRPLRRTLPCSGRASNKPNVDPSDIPRTMPHPGAIACCRAKRNPRPDGRKLYKL